MNIFFIIFLFIAFDAQAKSVPAMQANTNPATNDLIYNVDVSDTSESIYGTSKKETAG